MKITVVGAGYVGLVTAVCLAELGNEVLCLEKDLSKLENIKSGNLPIYEPGIKKLFKRNLEKNVLDFTDNVKKAIEFSQVIFVCVGTPQNKNGKADLSQVEEISWQIANNLNEYKLIIEKSTVPINTHEWIKKTINRYITKKITFDVASNPEFLREGSAIHDFMNPDRIIVGVESKRAEKIFKKLYSPFTEKGFTLLITTPSAAEMIKHVSNSFLAMKISYINMIADLCEKVDVDINVVANGIGYDDRIGEKFLNAGIGYGGSCFPKDVQAFIKIAEDYGLEFSLLKETEKINKERRTKFLEKIEKILWINKKKNIAIWGLSFKPGTDDIREAPSIDIITELFNMGAKLRLYDPKSMDQFKSLFPENESIQYFEDKYNALKNADALLIITEWPEFVNADLKKVKDLMRLPIIIDGRNIFNSSKMKDFDFEYYGIGR